MTVVALLLFGAGFIFLMSAVEDCDLKATLGDVLKGEISMTPNRCTPATTTGPPAGGGSSGAGAYTVPPGGTTAV